MRELGEILPHGALFLIFLVFFFLPNHSPQIFAVLGRLPQLRVGLSLRGVWAESATGRKEDRAVRVSEAPGRADWIQVHADQEYVLRVELTRIRTGTKVTMATEPSAVRMLCS